MKYTLILTVLLVAFAGCKKDIHIFPFDSRQSDFANYSRGQVLKFIDTASSQKTLNQIIYNRDFWRPNGDAKRSITEFERYTAMYESNDKTLSIDLYTEANAPKPVFIRVNHYFAKFLSTEVDHAYSTININGVSYSNVYKIKMIKMSSPDASDTATLFHNREYGVIQVLFPNGKAITRID